MGLVWWSTACPPSAQEAEKGGFRVQAQSALYDKTLSQKIGVFEGRPHSVDQTDLTLRDPPASASQVLVLKVCATMAQL